MFLSELWKCFPSIPMARRRGGAWLELLQWPTLASSAPTRPCCVLRGAEQLPHMPRDGRAGGLQSVALTPFPSCRTSDDVWPAAGSFGWGAANVLGPPRVPPNSRWAQAPGHFSLPPSGTSRARLGHRSVVAPGHQYTAPRKQKVVLFA